LKNTILKNGQDKVLPFLLLMLLPWNNQKLRYDAEEFSGLSLKKKGKPQFFCGGSSNLLVELAQNYWPYKKQNKMSPAGFLLTIVGTKYRFLLNSTILEIGNCYLISQCTFVIKHDDLFEQKEVLII
jgi:hypothetical protein